MDDLDGLCASEDAQAITLLEETTFQRTGNFPGEDMDFKSCPNSSHLEDGKTSTTTNNRSIGQEAAGSGGKAG